MAGRFRQDLQPLSLSEEGSVMDLNRNGIRNSQHRALLSPAKYSYTSYPFVYEMIRRRPGVGAKVCKLQGEGKKNSVTCIRNDMKELYTVMTN